jgi:hypothetical protein
MLVELRPAGFAMLRKLVVLCLVAVTAAGPWLCCCSAAQFAGRHTADSAPAAAVAAPPPAGVCPHCRHSAPRPAGKSEPAPAPATPRPCPCQDERPAMAPAAERAADGVAASALDPSSDLPPVVLAADALTTTPRVDSATAHTPQWPPRERLTLLHILRC